MRFSARAVRVWSVAEQNDECGDIALLSPCDRGRVVDPTLFRAVNQIGPVGRVS